MFGFVALPLFTVVSTSRYCCFTVSHSDQARVPLWALIGVSRGVDTIATSARAAAGSASTRHVPARPAILARVMVFPRRS